MVEDISPRAAATDHICEHVCPAPGTVTAPGPILQIGEIFCKQSTMSAGLVHGGTAAVSCKTFSGERYFGAERDPPEFLGSQSDPGVCEEMSLGCHPD